MNKKLNFDICSLIDFDNSFREKFDKCFKIRNYYTLNTPDVYFEFSYSPDSIMVGFIKEYAKSIGGIARFSSDLKRFEIYEDSKGELF